MNELEKYRAKIDVIDGKILLMLKKRFEVVEKIGMAKAMLHAPVKDKKRMEELYGERIKIAKKYGLPEKLIKKIFKDIVVYSMSMEKKCSG